MVQKSFWKKPEGKVGAIMLPLMLGGMGLAAWVYLLPFILSLLANTLAAVVMAAVLVFLFFTAINPNVHAAVEFLFKRGMYKMTDAIYRIDPIGVLRVAIINMNNKVREMAELKEQLSGHIKLLRRTIFNNATESKKAATAAEGANKYDRFVESRQAERLANSNVDYKAALSQLEGIDKCLDTYIKVTMALAKDSKNEADIRERDRNNLLKSHRILKAAAKTLKGHEAAMDQFNHGVQIIVEERLQIVSEVDNFAQLITDTVGKIDINAGIIGTDSDSVHEWERNADVLEKKVDLLLLGPGQPNPLRGALDATPRPVAYANAPKAGQRGRKTYSDMFGDDDK